MQTAINTNKRLEREQRPRLEDPRDVVVRREPVAGVPPLLRKAERQRDEPERDEDEHRDDHPGADATQAHRPHESRGAAGEHDERGDVRRDVQGPEDVHEARVSSGAVEGARREEPVNIEAAHVEARRDARAPQERSCNEPSGDEND
jgi:hypothetical protein